MSDDLTPEERAWVERQVAAAPPMSQENVQWLEKKMGEILAR